MFSSLLLFLLSFSCFSIFWLCGVASWFTPILWITHLFHLKTIITSIFTNLLSHLSVVTAQRKKSLEIRMLGYSCSRASNLPCLYFVPIQLCRQILPVSFLYCELLFFLCQPSVKELHLINLCACDHFIFDLYFSVIKAWKMLGCGL